MRHVYLGLDKKGDEPLEAIRNSTEVPPPNLVLDTSPGKHQVVWKVSGFTQDEAESLRHYLANQFAGDPAATDSTRVLRLPGFANRKLPEEFIVQAHQESSSLNRLLFILLLLSQPPGFNSENVSKRGSGQYPEKLTFGWTKFRGAVHEKTVIDARLKFDYHDMPGSVLASCLLTNPFREVIKLAKFG